jgi:hypothetical protein
MKIDLQADSLNVLIVELALLAKATKKNHEFLLLNFILTKVLNALCFTQLASP